MELIVLVYLSCKSPSLKRLQAYKTLNTNIEWENPQKFMSI